MDNTVAFFGDSLTEGFAVSNTRVKAENFGLSGETIEELTQRIPDYDLSGARAIVLETGINNYLQSGLDGFGAKYRRLLAVLPSRTPVIAMAILPMNRRIDTHAESLLALKSIHAANVELQQSCQAAANCRFLDLAPSLTDGEGLLKAGYEVGDGLHLNRSGYRVWADMLTPVLRH